MTIKLSYEDVEKIWYAAGHLIGSEQNPDDPNAAASRELAMDTFEDLIQSHVDAEVRHVEAKLERLERALDVSDRSVREWRASALASQEEVRSYRRAINFETTCLHCAELTEELYEAESDLCSVWHEGFHARVYATCPFCGEEGYRERS